MLIAWQGTGLVLGRAPNSKDLDFMVKYFELNREYKRLKLVELTDGT